MTERQDREPENRRGKEGEKHKIARELARCLASLEGLNGVPVWTVGGLGLLTDAPQRPPDPAALAQTLFGESPPRQRDLVRLVGAKGVREMRVGAVGLAVRNLTRLQTWRDLDALCQEGLRPLRKYRSLDLAQYFQSTRSAIDRCSRLLHSLDAVPRLDADEHDPHLLTQTLPLRLYALGWWPIDPLELLRSRDVPADPLLLSLATTDSDVGLAALAAILLGMRSRGGPAERREAVERELPGFIYPAYLAGLRHCPAPCLWALAHGQGHAGMLPNLSHIAEDSLTDAGLACERLMLLYGVPAGLTALRSLALPFQELGEVHERLQRFRRLFECRPPIGRPAPRSQAEAILLQGLACLDEPGHGLVEDLTELFLAWMTDHGRQPRLLGRRELARIARKATGPNAILRVLTRAWEERARQQTQVVERGSPQRQRACLALHLTFPDACLPVQPDKTVAFLDQARALLAGLPRQRVEELWPIVSTLDIGGPAASSRVAHSLLQSSLPAGLILRTHQMDLAHVVQRSFANRPKQLERYLDCVAALHQPKDLLDVKEDWFVNLFLTDRPWAATVVLTLLTRARVTSKQQDRISTLHALAESLRQEQPLAGPAQELIEALEEWSQPVVHANPPERSALEECLQLATETLDRYLHFRRLAGHGETLADALLEPLQLRTRENREAAFLSKRLASTDLTPDERSHLTIRLGRLIDPGSAAGRLAHVIDRTRKGLERKIELLREESLVRLLDNVTRDYLRQLLGKAVPSGPLPDGLCEALQLLSADQINQDLLGRFLRDVLQKRRFTEWAVNRDWLKQAEEAGIDTKAWLAGFSAVLTINGEPVAFATERNPFVILKMGSYFNTCLSLDEGHNAASTLINAVDVNKQVIYGRRKDGAVVARKLIGATLQGDLAGYNTYASNHPDLIRPALSVALVDYARRCRLRPSAIATPEILSGGFWYNDGNEDWLENKPTVSGLEPPPGGPNDPDAVLEWQITQAVERRDAERLRQLTGTGHREWNTVALYWLIHLEPGTARSLSEAPRPLDSIGLPSWLLARRSLAWVDCRPELLRDHDDLSYLIDGFLPVDRTFMTEAIRKFTSLPSHRLAAPDRPITSCNGSLGLLSADNLLRLFRFVYERELAPYLAWAGEEGQQRYHFVVANCAGHLQTAWLRDRENPPLVRALAESSPWLTAVVVELLRREVVPGTAPGLRKHLRRPPTRHLSLRDVALALGNQGEPQDGPRLLELLRQEPTSLDLAVAVVRCGNEKSAAEARQLWQPPRDPEQSMGRREWLARARELASPRLGRGINRAVRRLLEEYLTLDEEAVLQRVCGLLRHLSLLNLPAAGAEAQASTLAENISRQLAGSGHDYARHRIQALQRSLIAAADLAQLPEHIRQLAEGETAAQDALAWWSQLRLATADGSQALLHDELFERAVHQLAAGSNGPTRDAALESLLDLAHESERLILGERWLAVLGEERLEIAASLRRRIVERILPDHNYYTNEREAKLACVETLAVAEQREVLARHIKVFSDSDDPQPTWLTGFENGTPQRKQVLCSLLLVLAEDHPDALIEYLHLILTWLEPGLGAAVVEPFVRLLPATSLARYLSSDFPSPRYRLQEMMIRELLHGRTEADRKAAVEQIKNATHTARSAWVLRCMEPAPA
jgi:hypothetical protein